MKEIINEEKEQVRVEIVDVTLRDGAQAPGFAMSKKDKMAIARMLDAMHIDVIEAGFARSNDEDFATIKEISKVCEYATIMSLARCNKEDIDKASEALMFAKKKRIHVFIATSEEQMRVKLRKIPDEVRTLVREMVSYAESKCDDIEFSLEDATRTDWNFACDIINIAIENGATVINIPDTVGVTSVHQYEIFIQYIREHSKFNSVIGSVHCHNDLGGAAINTVNGLAIMKNKRRQAEVTVNGIGERAGNTDVAQIIANFIAHPEMEMYTNVNSKFIKPISDAVIMATGQFIQRNYPILGENANYHGSGIHAACPSSYEIIDLTEFGIHKDNTAITIYTGKNVVASHMEKCNLI